MLRKHNFFVVFCLMLVHFNLNASALEKVFVQGGEMKYKTASASVGSFEISKYEITNSQFTLFLNSKSIGANGILKGVQLINIISKDLQVEYKDQQWKAKSGYENHPMVMVNYYGAAEYCKWTGGRLPTEVEWIYAANGGQKNRNFIYAGSNSLLQVGWFKKNSESQSHPVGKKKPNQLGIYDMSGNAWEWCLNETLKTTIDFCVHMGGSWFAGEEPSKILAKYGNIPTHFSNSVGFRVLFPVTALTIDKNFFSNYKGKSWNNQPQQVPGKVQAEFYDLGGQEVAYHDNDNMNSGSGNLNPANGTFLNEFRITEGVDISYTKGKDIDNSPYNLVEPKLGELYAGWTMPGEWINYTIKVNQAGIYTLDLMYTASGNGGISLLLDGKELVTELLIPSTRHNQETIDWRQWHHWNKLNNGTSFPLKKGIHVLTLKTVFNGNMNFDYLEFKLKE
jgi:hypothetical protein